MGIISKADLKEGDSGRSARLLERAGASAIFTTSAMDKTGIQDFMALLAD